MFCFWVFEWMVSVEDDLFFDVGVYLMFIFEFKNYCWGLFFGKDVVLGFVDGCGCMWCSVVEVVVNLNLMEVEVEVRV